MLQKWVGIAYIVIDDEGISILNEAIKKELDKGLAGLSNDYEQLFTENLDQIFNKSLEDEKEWFCLIREAREETEELDIIIDKFSYPGSMRDWVGLH